MGSEKAWLVRRIVLSVLFLVIVAVPLYPESFGAPPPRSGAVPTTEG